MARLIDADLLMEKLNVFNDRVHGNEHFLYGIETAKELLEDMPTTTEAEIRAMALDEVIKAISNLLSGDTKHLEGGAYYKELAYLEVLHIAEQLKEE